MKQLLFASTAMFALAAIAGSDTGYISGTTFEGTTNGAKLLESGGFVNDGTPNYQAGDHYWKTVEDDLSAFFTNRNDLGAYNGSRPAYWDGEDTSSPMALALDVTAPLMRHVDKEGSEYDFTGGNLYFDSLVQFTAADDTPQIEESDKLVVWLYGNDETQQTNLVITAAGKIQGNQVENATNYVVSAAGFPVLPGEWHRLSIALAKDTTSIEESTTVSFKVYLDGNLLSAEPEDGGDAVSSFLSLVSPTETGSATITGVAFQGNGAVDDITFTNTDPFYTPAVEYFQVGESRYTTFAEALEAVEDEGTITLLRDYALSSEGESALSVSADESVSASTVTINLNEYTITGVEENNVIDIDGLTVNIVGSGSIVCTAIDESDSNYYAVSVANGTVKIGDSTSVPTLVNANGGQLYFVNGDAKADVYAASTSAIAITAYTTVGDPEERVVATWEADTDSAGYYKAVYGAGPTPEDPTTVTPGTPTVVTAENAEAAAGKLTITAPEGAGLADEALTAYQSYFTKVAVEGETEGTYSVTAELNASGTNALETATSVATSTDVYKVISSATFTADTEVELGESLKPGFYYSLDSGSALGTYTHPAGQLKTAAGTVTIKVKKLSGSGFYRVIASPAQIESTETDESAETED